MSELNAEKLRDQVKGKSDDAIEAFVETVGGADRLLELVFSAMKDAFDPQKAGGQRAVFQYDIDTADGNRTYQVTVNDGACEVQRDGAEKPRVTLSLSLPNFLRLVSGQLNGMQAFMSGQLKLSGDVMFAQTMQTWFIQRT